jgi:hypothetical protein
MANIRRWPATDNCQKYESLLTNKPRQTQVSVSLKVQIYQSLVKIVFFPEFRYDRPDLKFGLYISIGPNIFFTSLESTY